MSKDYINLGKPKNGWKKVGIIMLVLLIVSAGATGYSLYQYINQKGQLNDKQTALDKANADLKTTQNKLKKAEQSLADTTGNTSNTSSANSNSSYLVIKEWNIKYKIPDGISTPTYSFDLGTEPGTLDSNSLTVTSGDANVGVVRSSNKVTPMTGNYGQAVIQFGAYWYVVSGGQINSTDSTAPVVNKLLEMVKNPIKV
ncbi:hypothetical protein FWF48_03770 [Candidatus Saccharibacteria bacterium]|nr:hypothetical protein [Candidatus Saccharibacteria bacterium]